MRKFFLIGLAALTVLAAAPRARAVSTSASSAILMDAGSGRVLYESGADEPRLIASITKLMTALVAAEEGGDLSRQVTVQADWLKTEGSSIYLQAGETVTLEALLYGLLLESGNDAAAALACACAGTEEAFARRMNERAQALGMTRSHFENASGLNAEGHYSTARDMAKLAVACLNNQVVARACASRSARFGQRVFYNHNRLLSLYSGCVGMKTGYTQLAGRTLVSAAERNGQTLVAVTLNAPDDWQDHMRLLDYGFETYPAKALCRAGEVFGSVPVEGSLVRFVDVAAAEDFFYPLKAGETAEIRVERRTAAAAPISKGDSAGKMVYLLHGAVIGEVELQYAQTVHRDALAERTLLQRILSAIFGENVTVMGRAWP